MENDRLTLIGEKRLRQLLEVEKENEKLRKVCEAADKNANRDLTYEEHALRQALKEWKGE